MLDHLLVFRFSAMGDVTLTLPVLRSVLATHKNIHITLVTRKTFAPLFQKEERLEVIQADFTGKHQGVAGLFHLYRQVRKRHKYTAVIDLHDVLRTKLLDFLFRVSGISVYRIDKGRKEKKKLIRGKVDSPLLKTIDRYFAVFAQAGFASDMIRGPWLGPTAEPSSSREGAMIGIAPCARHPLKEWPIEHMTRLMQLIREKRDVKFYLFGGKEEREKMEKIARTVPDTSAEALDLPLEKQLTLMAQMHLMISMDSANMHLAALAGIPLVVIWGATHPYAGFTPVGDHEKGFVQIPRTQLDCRPCTVYGRGKCHRGDFACMQWVTPEMVYERVQQMNIAYFSD